MPGATKILNCVTQIFLLPVYGVAWLLGSPYLMTLLCIMSEVLVELVVSTVMAGVSLVVSAVILMEDDNRPLQVPPVDFQKAIKNIPKISPAQVEQSGTEESPTDFDAAKTSVIGDTFIDVTGDGTKPVDDLVEQLTQSDENEKSVTPPQELIAGEPDVQRSSQEGSGLAIPASIKEDKGSIQEGSITKENDSEQSKTKEESKQGSGTLETVQAAVSALANEAVPGTPDEQTQVTE